MLTSATARACLLGVVPVTPKLPLSPPPPRQSHMGKAFKFFNVRLLPACPKSCLPIWEPVHFCHVLALHGSLLARPFLGAAENSSAMTATDIAQLIGIPSSGAAARVRRHGY